MTYTGHCHCGAVRYEAETDLAQVLSCNCSHCTQHGLLLNFIPAAQFKLLSGGDNLTEYRFNKKMIAHLFCKTCGIESFARGKGKEGNDTVALNVRCLDGVDVDSLTLTPFDGKNW